MSIIQNLHTDTEIHHIPHTHHSVASTVTAMLFHPKPILFNLAVGKEGTFWCSVGRKIRKYFNHPDGIPLNFAEEMCQQSSQRPINNYSVEILNYLCYFRDIGETLIVDD